MGEVCVEGVRESERERERTSSFNRGGLFKCVCVLRFIGKVPGKMN